MENGGAGVVLEAQWPLPGCPSDPADVIEAVWVYSPATHKNAYRGHARTIFVGPKAQAVLAAFLKPLNPTAFVFSPKDAEAEMH